MWNHSQDTAKILLLEDTEDDAFLFKHALKQAGVPSQMKHLVDGGEALEFFASLKDSSANDRPDIIFLDLKLPKYSGFEILEWVQVQNFQPPLKITVLSGSDHPSDISTARKLGVTDYVVKPISAEELKRRLLGSLSSRTDQSAGLVNQPCQ